LGHRIDAKKAASEKAQTTVSENGYTSEKMLVTFTCMYIPTLQMQFLEH